MLAAGDPQRVHDYLYALTQHFASKGVVSLLTFETGLGPYGVGDRLTEQLRFSGITDCMIVFDLQASDRLRRTGCVLKARNSAHDLAIREMEITATGLRIG
jgi:KaiC/GvpD/RAD55 family RecA-like ATPase